MRRNTHFTSFLQQILILMCNVIKKTPSLKNIQIYRYKMKQQFFILSSFTLFFLLSYPFLLYFATSLLVPLLSLFLPPHYYKYTRGQYKLSVLVSSTMLKSSQFLVDLHNTELDTLPFLFVLTQYQAQHAPTNFN
jgi:hypothetical protein